MLLFVAFGVLAITKTFLYPETAKQVFLDFKQVSFLGAIIITFDNIIAGISTYYHERAAAAWAAYGMFWIAMTLTVTEGCVALQVACCYQKPHRFSEVSGTWLLSFIPFIVTSSLGSTLIPHLNRTNQEILLVVSFLSWSLGEILCSIIVAIYFWRLLSSSLPPRSSVISCFIPMGPFGLGAYAIQTLASSFSTYIKSTNFHLSPSSTSQISPENLAAVAETIEWISIMVALAFVSFSTFWLIHATSAVILRMPIQFNVGFWSCVFPLGVYTLAVERLAFNLNNAGFRGWAATCCVVTVLLWLGCTCLTMWSAIWKGGLSTVRRLESIGPERHDTTKEREGEEEALEEGMVREFAESRETNPVERWRRGVVALSDDRER
ncbi:MAG: hypothetical protein M1820_002483 [Bogoriella megaspora]|nr:MAG: hypothetical protein M1820_002483 [Bogoriella megaspora]